MQGEGSRAEEGGTGAPALGTPPSQPREGASLPSTAQSWRRKRLLQTRQEGSTGSCCWHWAGLGLGLGLGCLLSLPLARWEPYATLTSWMKVRSGFQMLGLLLPAQPGQLDPPKTGSLLSAAFYRTIKPEVQVRSLRQTSHQNRQALPQALSCLHPLQQPPPPGRARGCCLPSLSLTKTLQPQRHMNLPRRGIWTELWN